MIKIHELQVENYRGIRKFAAILDDSVTVLDGPNGAGKSSVLKAICETLAGGKKIDDTGNVLITLSDGTKIQLAGKKLTVRGADGKIIAKPQTALTDSLGPAKSLDPLSVLRSTPKQQAEIVESLTGEEFIARLSVLKNEYDKLYADRHAVGVALKAFSRPEVPPAVDFSEEKLVAAANSLKAAEKAEFDYRHAQQMAERLTTDIEVIESELEKKRAQLKNLLSVEKPHDDVVGLRSEYDALVSARGAAASRESAIKKLEEYSIIEKKHAKLDIDTKLAKESLDKHISSAVMPIEGLTCDVKNGIAVDGVLLSEMSRAEQIIVSTKIVSALNPGIGLIVIEDGTVLTGKSLVELIKYCITNGHQLLIEMAGKSSIPANTIHIVDGEIATEAMLLESLGSDDDQMLSIGDLLASKEGDF